VLTGVDVQQGIVKYSFRARRGQEVILGFRLRLPGLLLDSKFICAPQLAHPASRVTTGT
jgi:hypothetical protein